MPIPDLDENGLLPPGVFECNLSDVRKRFGAFQASDRRPRLFARLEDLVFEMGQSGLFESIVIDGSFTTGKNAPNDIDLVAIMPQEHDFERELSATEYAMVSRSLLRRRFGFDVVLAKPRFSTLLYIH
jgi:hypothetical protein